MTSPVPFTRAAVDLIRKGASARDLGWSDGMYARVCRNHGLKVVEPAPFERPKPPTNPYRLIRYDDGLAVIEFNGRVVSLRSPSDATIFATLLHRARKGDDSLMPSEDFRSSRERKWSTSQFCRLVDRLNETIAPLGLIVETKRGNGYRLLIVQSVA